MANKAEHRPAQYIPPDHPIAGRLLEAERAQHQAIKAQAAAIKSGDTELLKACLADVEKASAAVDAIGREYLREIGEPEDRPIGLRRSKSGHLII